jgi:hypothetical protein
LLLLKGQKAHNLRLFNPQSRSLSWDCSIPFWEAFSVVSSKAARVRWCRSWRACWPTRVKPAAVLADWVGLGDVMNSWIGKGENMPISADQLSQVLGGDMIGKITQATGMNQGDLLGQLSQMLPGLVDKVTPDGQIPQAGLGDIGAILGKFVQPR